MDISIIAMYYKFSKEESEVFLGIVLAEKDPAEYSRISDRIEY
ncbi:MAG: hypothetical protein Q8L88_04510 [Bacteroidota bacterium]|nr:hypothetical protein [Bacteroidota bacterium]